MISLIKMGENKMIIHLRKTFKNIISTNLCEL